MVSPIIPPPPTLSFEKLEAYKDSYSEVIGLVTELHNYHSVFLDSPAIIPSRRVRACALELRRALLKLLDANRDSVREIKENRLLEPKIRKYQKKKLTLEKKLNPPKRGRPPRKKDDNN